MSRQLSALESLFKALADVTRLRILGLLLAGEVCVCDIHESLKLPQPTVSRHLAYLRRTGLVLTRRSGLWVHYRLAPAADPVTTAVLDAVRHALTHVESVQRDGARLMKRTGCCIPAPVAAGVEGPAACCAPGPNRAAASPRTGDTA